MKRSRAFPTLGLAVAVPVLACLCLAGAGLAGLVIYGLAGLGRGQLRLFGEPTAAPRVIRPTPGFPARGPA